MALRSGDQKTGKSQDAPAVYSQSWGVGWSVYTVILVLQSKTRFPVALHRAGFSLAVLDELREILGCFHPATGPKKEGVWEPLVGLEDSNKC